MTLKSKLKSNRGYVFTYEAVAVVIIFVAVFYMGYFTFTHVNLTNQEHKRDIERFEKANLVSDMLFKMHELPSNSYVPDYMNFLKSVSNRYYGLDKIPGTFDPNALNEQQFSYTETWHYDINITNPGTTDLTDFQVFVVLNPSNFNFDFSTDGSGISFWNGNTQLNYWIETWEYNKEARIWIKVNSLPKNSVTTVELRRNQAGSYQSNGENTFIFFDDFENGLSKWTNLRGTWSTPQSSELSFYNGGSGINRVAYVAPNSQGKMSLRSSNPLNVGNNDIYILEGLAKGYAGASTGQADSPDTMIGFYSNAGTTVNNIRCYNSFTGDYQVLSISRNYDQSPIYSSMFTGNNVWYYHKYILGYRNNNNKRCDVSLWEFNNGYMGDPNPNLNTNSNTNSNFLTPNIPNSNVQGNYILIGAAQGTHDEEFWFDNIKVRKYAPNINVDVYEMLEYNAGQNAVDVLKYNFEGIPNILSSNVNLVEIEYNYTVTPNTYVKTRNLYVPVKTWRYSNVKSVTESINSGEILYFAVRRPSTLSNISIKSNTNSNTKFLVNGVPFEIASTTNDKITNFGKVISTNNWEYYEPNEIKLLNATNNANITLTINYDSEATFYVLKLRQYEISCILDMDS
ncbi:hypothetical protein Mevan_1252 [Methanococcus vannielii SB]|jgi:hypothetical protein|uniref:DUF2341 domain-containing protein n=1 Tax=Methanococcus vannielii (strain ATCC 35089 / DSM 1224 / JCM 13029 / OCM 148 / SB) TaxID=406327 RepID=A6URM7_METVS|nr:DUF2341 domain-containing protein [Methanococcus vannielii]ABR55149.1 hypothetical protein Mevan_1252 [Methanococcus vannielii SB]